MSSEFLNIVISVCVVDKIRVLVVYYIKKHEGRNEMGVFIKRPLCLFCFCFIAAALAGCFVGKTVKLALLFITTLCAVVFFVLGRKMTKRKYGFIQSAIALLFSVVALCQSFVFIDAREDRLNSLMREGALVEFVVISEEYSSKYSTKYEGKLLSIDDSDVEENAFLVLEHEADFVAGDRIFLIGNVSRTENNSSGLVTLPEDTSLEIISTIDKDLLVSDEYRDFNISVMCGRIRSYVKGVFLERLDKVSASLSLGILTGDSSMIETSTVRDFRRVGLSHILAVSGLHLSVILGAFDFLLRSLCVGKGKRCVVITLLSLLLLALSGFSASACRAVLMLLCAYLCYALSREPDTLTSLSVAGALMLFVSPLSVGSVSFWLSFLATLGIVLYAELLRDTRRKRASEKGAKECRMSAFVKKIFGALAVTLSANVFIVIIFWIFFGEVSVISPISNLLIAPLAEVYLILTVLVFVVGGFPLIGVVLSYAATLLCTLMIELASAFSSLDFSVVSLNYPFAGAVICIATVLISVLFIVKLRRRFVISLVPVASILVFCVCLVVYNTMNTSVRVTYINEDERDSLLLTDSARCVLVDVSDGSYASFYNSREWFSETAFTEIESVVLTHYHARHVSSLDRLFKEEMVRVVCLPAPTSAEELDVMKDIISSALENGVAVKLYTDEQIFSVCEGFEMFKLRDGLRDGSTRKIISFSIQTREGMFTYADRSWHQADTNTGIAHFISSSEAVVLGCHGPIATEYRAPGNTGSPSVIVGADKDIFAHTPDISDDSSVILVGRECDGVRICEFDFCLE